MAIKGNEFDRKISLLLLKTNVPTAPEQLSHQMSELPNAGKKTAGPTGKANTPRVMEVTPGDKDRDHSVINYPRTTQRFQGESNCLESLDISNQIVSNQLLWSKPQQPWIDAWN
ncbi:Protein CBG11465 [Caenorhabditis briggsae]|uniref:Uncharacterized protein n=2 Tax=Caenorhabditis briggsae TaxID=6238 RepID=A0AAE9CXR4_CAEBR|nr:Protein CBG11465 [Caenorhabditis briggsae]ULT85850.1 hypothetical protein L3Y34_005907 [Caenorhabditis briggsae]CAP30502.1 Protein CBG11465 [Caenorhabditis briggsae]